MKLTIDDAELKAFNQQLGAVKKVFDKPFLRQALKNSLKPVEAIAKREAPKGAATFKSAATRTSRSGIIKRDGTHDRGGALSRSIRILIVEGRGEETLRGLVGPSKKRGRAGWRAVFSIRGTRNRHTSQGYNRGSTAANDFLDRAERQGTPLVISSLGASAQEVVRKALAKYT